jgi:hypothetical protein
MISPSHSVEIERRITIQEVHTEAHGDRLAAVEKRMSLHEKAILAIAAVLQVVLQDKYPALAALLKGLL